MKTKHQLRAEAATDRMLRRLACLTDKDIALIRTSSLEPRKIARVLGVPLEHVRLLLHQVELTR